MNKNNKTSLFANIQYDLPASIVVFLVALPLCLGIALASGAPLFSGIIAGIVGGIVVAAFSGSALGVSGPAAGLAVIVLSAIQEFQVFEIFLLAVLVSGVIQLILGIAKSGVIAYYFPSSVIKGMLSAIGIIIFLKQLPHAVGYDADPEGDMSFVQVDGHNTLSELSYMLDYISPGAIIIAMLSLAILILWEMPFMKRKSIFKIIQGPLVVVALGIVLNVIFKANENFALAANQVVNLPISDSFIGFFSHFTLPDFSQWNNPLVYKIAVTMAVVASLETLLCVEATDKLDPQKRVTPANRELIAQGLGNMVSGFIGGLPITQVIVRSSANIQSGGRTKLSALLHGVLLLVSVMAIPNLLNLIPLSSLAAILLVVGYKLAKPVLFKQMYRKGMEQFIPFMITVVGIVFTDLLIGIALGLVVGIMQILWNNYKTPYHIDESALEAGKPIRIELSEDVSFLNKAGILNTLNKIPDGSEVVIDAKKTVQIHPDVIEIIEDFQENAKTRNVKVNLQHFDSIVQNDAMKSFDKAIKDEREHRNDSTGVQDI